MPATTCTRASRRPGDDISRRPDPHCGSTDQPNGLTGRRRLGVSPADRAPHARHGRGAGNWVGPARDVALAVFRGVEVVADPNANRKGILLDVLAYVITVILSISIEMNGDTIMMKGIWFGPAGYVYIQPLLAHPCDVTDDSAKSCICAHDI
jgi:hypothetical protein